jgi:hypothetical protein
MFTIFLALVSMAAHPCSHLIAQETKMRLLAANWFSSIFILAGTFLLPRLEGYVTQNFVGKIWKNEVTRAVLFPSVSRYINTPGDLTLQQSTESIYFWTPWLKEFRGVRWGFFVVSQKVPSTKNVCELDFHGFSKCSMIFELLGYPHGYGNPQSESWTNFHTRGIPLISTAGDMYDVGSITQLYQNPKGPIFSQNDEK